MEMTVKNLSRKTLKLILEKENQNEEGISSHCKKRNTPNHPPPKHSKLANCPTTYCWEKRDEGSSLKKGGESIITKNWA